MFVRITSAGVRESHVHDVHDHQGGAQLPGVLAIQPMASVPRPVDAPAATHADIHADRILILDFGSQYTQLIARRVRELGVYCEIHPWDMSDAEVRAFAPTRRHPLRRPGVGDRRRTPPRAPQAVFELGVPVLGICYGMQTMAQQLGGRSSPAPSASSATPRYAPAATPAARRHRGPHATRRGHGAARCVDEPRRSRRRAAARIHAHRLHRRRAPRRPWPMSAPLLRRAVPSRGHAHHAGRAHLLSASCTRSAAAASAGAPATSSRMRSRACARRWARARCCSDCPAAWIPPWSPRCCTGPSATS